MGLPKGTVGFAIAAACFLPGNASAFGRMLVLDRVHAHAAADSSHAVPDFFPLISTSGGRGVNAAANESIKSGLPCPKGPSWQAADSTREPVPQKSTKPKATTEGQDARQRSASDKPRATRNKTASTSKAHKSGTDKSIIFVGGKPGKRTEAPAACCRGKTGELRHDKPNIRPEEKK